MTIDEKSGSVTPETAQEEKLLKNDKELAVVIKSHFERKEQKKGSADRFFERKAKREGWSNNHKK